MHNYPIPLLMLFVTALSAAEGYDPEAFCGEARWNEWRRIVAETQSFTAEREDAIHMLQTNRRLCEDVKAGRDLSEVNDEYWQEFYLWISRVKERQIRRSEGMLGAG